MRDSLDRLGRDSTDLLRAMADDVENGYDRTSAEQWHEGARRLGGPVQDLRNARGWTQESYRFNPGRRLRRHPGPPPGHWDTYWTKLADRLESVTATLVDTTGEWRSLASPPEPALRCLPELFRAMADVCQADRAALGAAVPPDGDARKEAMGRAWEAHRLLKRHLLAHDHETATAVGGLAAQTQQLLYALEAGPAPARQP
ncbi:hypothetical protein [Streptomyces sp. Tu 2975]|uniref:hypothetical protein n=1 Tax=Streptomyces sp. Tu 2975 TaxID=2676871 RepID=UPI001FC9539F|nr:hypothetical protein [Streptomyces sp. Tu 2975]